MNYLIDTQVFIWSLINPEKLSATARYSLQNANIYVSVTSLFEITIKQKIGKLPLLPVLTNELVEQIKHDGFELLPVISPATITFRCWLTIVTHLTDCCCQ